ncbi:MAG: zinc ribbon domain-containing protein [Candidatus Marinimicrobia bacterium]|mgnify:FL=1|nr:zinc ribbon domain-containing protein [Candidatus Neomarinimicrobiota bacterium]MBT4784077.1 zinc ribbon domain-containing protein [Candidatus Neomarinimicrobiota bacterium]
MNRLFAFVFFLGFNYAQVSPFNSYDVVLYPEYYFDGLMAEIDAEVKDESLPLDLEIRVPINADSIFFVSGTASSEAEVKNLPILNSKNRSFVKINILESKFRLFIFYNLDKKGNRRTGVYDLELNHFINDAHIIVQVPLVAEGFTFSEKDSEEFKDQHGINFQRVHLHDFMANTIKSVSFSYENPTGEISINKLQTMLSTDDQIISPSTPNSINQIPIRHKLPLWQPLAVLGVVSLTVGWMFSVNRRKEMVQQPSSKSSTNKGSFCTNCGQSFLPEHKFCSNCGGHR